MMEIIRAEPGDASWPALLDLLKSARLPTSDVGEPGQLFFLFNEAGQTIGCGGFLVAGDDVLLRSVALVEKQRGKGLGAAIVGALLSEARRTRAKEAWLLTNSAEAFFEKAGWTRVPRETASPVIRATPQFSGICPGSAAFMHKRLSPDV